MEVHIPVQVFQVEFLCDECEQGYMRPLKKGSRIRVKGKMLIRHECTNPECKTRLSFHKQFPVMQHINLERLEEAINDEESAEGIGNDQ